MALTSRISLTGSEPAGPEDFLSTSLGVIFPDDVTNQHGDAEHSLVYASPYLPRPLVLELADPEGETERRLFSHYLWNASLLLAELVERDTLGVGGSGHGGDGNGHGGGGNGHGGGGNGHGGGGNGHGGGGNGGGGAEAGVSFDVTGQAVVELGAGTALPSIMAALVGARRVVVTDYPAPGVLGTLAANVGRNVQPDLAPGRATAVAPVAVQGHRWGELPAGDGFTEASRHAFDRVLAADCLWMPWQHANLHRSIAHFLKPTAAARCWVVAGFHTGRDKMRGFFDARALAAAGLAVDAVWERDCDGRERAWAWDRGDEDVTLRKRWLVVAVLRRASRLPCPYLLRT